MMANPLRSFSVTEVPECMICSEWFDDKDSDLIPRNLACGHSLCSRCVTRCMALNGQLVDGGISVICPQKCTQRTVVPDGIIQNLPKNFAVLEIIYGTRERSMSFVTSRSRSASQPLVLSTSSPLTTTGDYNCDVCESSGATVVCSSCAVCLCQPCSDDIHSRKGYQVHVLVPVGEFMDSTESISSNESQLTSSIKSDSSSEESQCKAHPGTTLEYFCESCHEEVCKTCLVHGEHKEHAHECRPMADIAIEKREVLWRMAEKVNQRHAEWNKGFDDCQEWREHLFTKRRNLESSIQSRFHAIHSALHAKEESMLSTVRSEIEARSNMLNSQADHLAEVCRIAKELADQCDDLTKGSNSEIVRHADHFLAQAQQYVRSAQDTNPVVTDSIEADFSCEKELMTCVERLGQLKMAPGRVVDLQVKSDGINKLVLSWKPPKLASTFEFTVNTYIAESASGNGPYRVVYEGDLCSCVVEGCPSEEDTEHKFRVAAVNNVGTGPYCMAVAYTQRKASFLWDDNLKHPKANISNNGYTVSIGENATWVSVGTNTVLTHGQHYWEVVLERYGSPSMSRKVVIGVAKSGYPHHWHRSHGVIGIKTCPIGHRSWGLACGTAKKLSSGSIFLSSIGRRHDLFKEGDVVGIYLDLSEHKMAFYKNREPLGIQFNDVYGPVIPAISFCRNKALTLRFPPIPEHVLSPPITHANTFPLTIPKEHHHSSRSPSPSRPKREGKLRSSSSAGSI